MKCLCCGGEMKVGRENVKYNVLPNVTLVNVEVSRCQQCGEFEVGVPHVEELHLRLANLVIRKRDRLTPAEFSFLRRYMGWSGADLARHVGVTPETVSKWQTGNTPISSWADRLIRVIVAMRDALSNYPIETLAKISKEMRPEPLRRFASNDDHRWQELAA